MGNLGKIMMHSDSISYYWLLLMTLEPQAALLISLADQHGTDSVVGSRTDATRQFLIGGLLPYTLRSLVALTLMLHSRDSEVAPQEAATPGSAQKPAGLQTQIRWERSHTTQRCPRALGVILPKRGDASSASRNGGQGISARETRRRRSRAFR